MSFFGFLIFLKFFSKKYPDKDRFFLHIVKQQNFVASKKIINAHRAETEKNMNQSQFTPELESKIQNAGWKRIYCNNVKLKKYDKMAAIFVKSTKIEEIMKNSAEQNPQIPCVSTDIENAPNNSNGCCNDMSNKLYNYNNINNSYSFNSDFVENMRSDDFNLLISCDHCWRGNNNNKVISYNYSLIDNEFIYFFIFFPFLNLNSILNLDFMLGVMLDYLNFTSYRLLRKNIIKYKYINSLNDNNKPIISSTNSYHVAISNSNYLFSNDGKGTNIPKELLDNYKCYSNVLKTVDSKSRCPLSVSLILNHGLSFLSSLQDFNDDSNFKYQIVNSNSVIGESDVLFSIRNIKYDISSVMNNGHNYMYNLNLNIRDVSKHKLKDLNEPRDFGVMAGVMNNDYSNTEFGTDFLTHLDEFFLTYPGEYCNYASERTSGLLMYISRLYGFNSSVPCSLMSAAVKVSKDVIMNSLSCSNDDEYYLKFAGTKKQNKLNVSESGKFYHNGNRVPLDYNCDALHRMASLAYRGGYNACFSVDVHHNKPTYDVDMASAYPSAMYMIPCIQYPDCIDVAYHKGYKLKVEDFDVPGVKPQFVPLFALVTYQFPEKCKYPCLPRNTEDDDEAPSYPLCDFNPVYCCGAELYHALQLGADITVIKGYRAKVLRDDNGNVVFPYVDLTRELVNARVDARQRKANFEEKIIKLITNSLYGKTSQYVSHLYSNDNEKGKECEITNPVSASLITSFVRATLCAALNDISNNSYNAYSCTTDGLITDMPFEQFEKMKMYGFNACLQSIRSSITGDPNAEAWSIKHVQNDLINITTRGNASFSVSGVFAKSNMPTPLPEYPKDGVENRKAFIEKVVSRTGSVQYEIKNYTSLKEYRKSGHYTQDTSTKTLSLDYDMKRKPIQSTLTAEYVQIDDNQYVMAHVETEPFANTDEMLLYRAVRNEMKCLRTVDEWIRFFEAVELRKQGIIGVMTTVEHDRKILRSCVLGYRAEKWDIPYLANKKISLDDKIQWINSFNSAPDHPFTKGEWKKAGEKSRQKNIMKIGRAHV